MFNQNGLSLDQAPPISVVFRFFIAGALFGIGAGLTLIGFGDRVFALHTPPALILTHLFTLGVMLSFMFAALFQMLPVIAGVKLTAPIQKANRLQSPFVLGTLSLLAAFYTAQPWLYGISSLLLGGSLFYTLFIMLKNLFELSHHSTSSKGMILALLSLAIVTLLALYLTGTHAGVINGIYFTQIRAGHYAFGLFGWMAMLIIAISFQVIEMFYVTPPYPKIISHYLPATLFGILFIAFIGGLFFPSVWIISDIFLALLLSAYALLTLWRLTQKKRPLSDATVWFWRVGLGLLIISMSALIDTRFASLPKIEILSYITFAGFALSIVFAMFYKIVPFLTWFHLNAQGYFTAPMMHEVIHPKTAKIHLYIHLATLGASLLSLVAVPFIYLAGGLLVLSFGWMLWQVVYAWKRYVQTQREGEKFEMSIPQS